MKKLLLLVLSMAMMVCAVPHMAFAANTTLDVNGLTYELTSDGAQKTAELKEGKNATDLVQIPATILYDGNNYDVTTIGKKAFENCSLTSVSIPDSVTSIGEEAFEGCGRLESVTIGNGVTAIKGYTFDQCHSLTSVTIGSNVALIGKNAFAACINLESVQIPDSVTSIGDNAFEYCHSLESVTIGSSVNTIGELAFNNCESLRSIRIPESVDTIGYQAFDGCSSLISIIVDNENPYFESSEEGVLFSKGGEALLICPCGKTGNYNIPDRVKTIDDYAFTSSSLTSVTIGSGVTSIGDFAFWYCDSLESVEFSSNVLTEIGANTFQQCYSLNSVELPNSVKTIGDSAFEGCNSLTSVTIGSNVNVMENIGGSAFEDCDSLTSITIPCNFNKGKFEGTGITVGANNTFTNSGGSLGSFILRQN